MSTSVEGESQRESTEGAPSARGLSSWLANASFVLGSIGLLLAGAVDALAVVGRHIGLPLLGSIEIVQACVVLMGSSALIRATLQGGHASVHLLTDRLPRRAARRLASTTAALSALAFAALAYGALLVLRDLWGGDEQSELLGLPYAPLRLTFLLSLLLVVSIFVRAALRRDGA